MKSQTDLGDTVLLLEGLGGYDLGQSSRRRSNNMKCLRRKRTYDRYGKPIWRCAKFSGGGSKGLSGTGGRRSRRSRSLFGQTDISRAGGLLANAKPVLITGGLAAVGAWASQALSARIGEALKLKPEDTMTPSLLTIAIGVILGSIVGKATKKPDFGVALGVGAVAVTALNFIGSLSSTSSKTAGWGVLTAEPAPYFQPASGPPLAFPSMSNLYTGDAGMAAMV